MRCGLVLWLKGRPASATARGARIHDLESAASELVHIVQRAFIQKGEALGVDHNTRSRIAKNIVCFATGAELHLVLHSGTATPLDGQSQTLIWTGFFFFQQASQLKRRSLGYIDHDYLVFPTGDEVK